MLIKRKYFEKTFLEFATKNKKIGAIGTVKELHQDIIDIAVRLADLEFINYVRISNEAITASSEIKGTKIKIPISTMNHDTAIGIEIVYHTEYKSLDFFEINSPVKGNGSQMVSAVLTNLPKDWNLYVIMDWSNGFWKKMEEKHADREWNI